MQSSQCRAAVSTSCWYEPSCGTNAVRCGCCILVVFTRTSGVMPSSGYSCCLAAFAVVRSPSQQQDASTCRVSGERIVPEPTSCHAASVSMYRCSATCRRTYSPAVADESGRSQQLTLMRWSARSIGQVGNQVCAADPARASMLQGLRNSPVAGGWRAASARR